MAIEAHRVAIRMRGAAHSSLRNQLVRAAMSIPTNIVEGRGQKTEPEFSRFLGYSIASLSELEYHLMIAHDIHAIDDQDFRSLVTSQPDKGHPSHASRFSKEAAAGRHQPKKPITTSRGSSQLKSLQGSAAPRAAQKAFTLLDIVLTLSLILILTAVSIPKASSLLDSISVHGASTDAFTIFSAARHAAVGSASQATVEIDTTQTTMLVRVKSDTILKRSLGTVHSVKLSTSRPSITFSASGMGYGAGNLTLVIKRGKSVDSLFVSRLGRVRH